MQSQVMHDVSLLLSCRFVINFVILIVFYSTILAITPILLLLPIKIVVDLRSQ